MSSALSIKHQNCTYMPILSRLGLIHGWGLTEGGWDLSERLDRLAVHAKVATFLDSISASTDTVESEGQQMKQCWITYIKKKKSIKSPIEFFLGILYSMCDIFSAQLFTGTVLYMHALCTWQKRTVCFSQNWTDSLGRIYFSFKDPLCFQISLFSFSFCLLTLVFFIPALNSTEWNVNIITGSACFQSV